MDERTLKDLIKDISGNFQSNLSKDGDIETILKKIEKGTATYEDAYEYSECVAAALSKALDKNITATMFETGQLDFETLKDILLPTYKEAHEKINETCKNVQKALNESAKLGMNPAEVGFRSRRVVGIAKNASKREIFSEVRYAIMGPYLENFAQNVVDDNVKANVDLHGKAGLRPKVNRLLNGEGCEFCRTWAGEWEYPKVPKEVYQRHDNCRCTVVYDPGDGRKQDVWTKTFYDANTTKEIQLRIDEVNKQSVKNVTTEYLQKARPGDGKYIPYPEIDEKNEAKEIKCAHWMISNFGGDVEMLKATRQGRKCDFLWHRGSIPEYWEEKGVSSIRSIDDQIHSAMGQIQGDHCGIVINIERKKADTETMVEEIKYRLAKRSKFPVVDIIVKDGEDLVGIYRFEK